MRVDRHSTDDELMGKVVHPRRSVSICDWEHHNGGNTCRFEAWENATGVYCLYLDDDNFLSDDTILEDIASALESADKPQWGLFPILRHGQWFYYDPPYYCSTDTGNVVVRREIGQWPNVQQRESDWALVERLLGYPYKAFPEFRPIIVMPSSNFGKAESAL